MNWYKTALLEKDWYKNWSYHISQTAEHLLGPIQHNSTQWFTENSKKDILSRETTTRPQLMDMEVGKYKVTLFLNYSSYFYVIGIQGTDKTFLYISFYRYNGLDFLHYNTPITVKQDMRETTPYDIIINIQTALINVGDEEYKNESRLVLQNADYSEEE